MSAESRQTLVLFLLVLCIGLLMLRDWQLQGEVDFLHERVSAVDGLHGREYIARILRARTDEAAEAAARGATT